MDNEEGSLGALLTTLKERHAEDLETEMAAVSVELRRLCAQLTREDAIDALTREFVDVAGDRFLGTLTSVIADAYDAGDHGDIYERAVDRSHAAHQKRPCARCNHPFDLHQAEGRGSCIGCLCNRFVEEEHPF